jgi:hypothetical protein
LLTGLPTGFRPEEMYQRVNVADVLRRSYRTKLPDRCADPLVVSEVSWAGRVPSMKKDGGPRPPASCSAMTMAVRRREHLTGWGSHRSARVPTGRGGTDGDAVTRFASRRFVHASRRSIGNWAGSETI